MEAVLKDVGVSVEQPTMNEVEGQEIRTEKSAFEENLVNIENLGEFGREGNSNICEGPEESLDEVVDIDKSVPCPGIQFMSWQKIEAFYKSYGKSLGFGVSRTQSALATDKITKRAMTWRCECWGDPDMKINHEAKKISKGMELGGSVMSEKTIKKRRKSKKCGCKAMVYASINSSRIWVIRKVILEHEGHTPSPEKSKLVKEYRMQYLNTSVRNRLLNDFDVGVSVAKIHGSIAREREGLENMPITERDMRHVIDKRRRLKMEGGDAMALFKYFETMQRDNDMFFHSYRVDESGRLKDVFWADARSRVAYEDFGDVVCFDSTYLTNKYKLPFANFVGVNHHGQSLLLGCALLSHEDSDTFKWVFTQWLLCMGGKAPSGILTDQAYAMRKPLAEVMPLTRHRWCIWHILRKLPHKIGKHPQYDDVKEELLGVIYDSLSVEEFESGWARVVSKYNVQKVEWLVGIYKERAMWVPAFMNDQFWAGMRTTQRVESMNSYFDQFLKRSTRLCDFGEKYVAAVERRVSQEKEADLLGEKYVRNPVTGIAIELYFRKIYTDAKYCAVQKECERLFYCYHITEMQTSENEVLYFIEDRVWKYCRGGAKQYLSDDRRMLRVRFNCETKDIECECRLFETHGILCRHCIRIYDINRVYTPPDKYVLRRWRKDIVRKHSLIKVAYHDPLKTEHVKRFDSINAVFQPIALEATTSEKAAEIVKKGLKKNSSQLHSLGNNSIGMPSPANVEETRNEVLNLSQNEYTQYEGGNTTAGTSNAGPHIQAGPQIQSMEDINLDDLNGMDYGIISVTDGVGYKGVVSPPNNLEIPDLINVAEGVVLDPPLPLKKRGRPKSIRYKSPGEKGWKQSNNSKATTSSKVSDSSPNNSKARRVLDLQSEAAEGDVNPLDDASLDDLIRMISWH